MRAAMARAPRLNREDGLYHVTGRGNARSRIFHADEDRERFVERLAHGCESDGVVLHAYVLMDNHFHLVVRTPHANLSRFMQRLMTAYALYARYRHKRPGHVFQGRFGAKGIESERYLRDVTRYVHLNPVKTKAARQTPLEQRRRRLDAYRWSSYQGYLRSRDADVFVDAETVLRHFSTDPASARRAYRRFVEKNLAETDDESQALMKGHRLAIGSESFADTIDAELETRRTGGPTDADLGLAPARPSASLDRIERAVAARYGIRPEALREDGRRLGDAKAVVVELACRLTGMSQRAVGAHFGGVTGAAVGQLRRALREGRASDSPHPRAQVVEEIQREIVGEG